MVKIMETVETQEQTTTTNNEVETETGKTYTEAEVQALLQQEGDRRVSQALKKQQAKQDQQMKEAEKLARMNEQEKYQYQLEQREAQLAEREKALALAENKNVASKILAEKGLSLDLVDFIVSDDADTMDANIKAIEKAFKASVKNEVEKRLQTSQPRKNFVDSDTMTREKLLALPINQLNDMLNNNPQLAELLK